MNMGGSKARWRRSRVDERVREKVARGLSPGLGGVTSHLEGAIHAGTSAASDPASSRVEIGLRW
jgi:hypothetical protein